jgi:hypothetical protein
MRNLLLVATVALCCLFRTEQGNAEWHSTEFKDGALTV